jgi:phosphoheptose isomerase
MCAFWLLQCYRLQNGVTEAIAAMKECAVDVIAMMSKDGGECRDMIKQDCR